MAQKKKTIPHGNLPENFDYEHFRNEVISDLIEEKPLTGESGLLQPLIADFVQGALDAEMQDHLNTDRAEGISNRRNGRQSKTIRSESGDVKIRRKDGVTTVALYVVHGISVEGKREIVTLYPGQG